MCYVLCLLHDLHYTVFSSGKGVETKRQLNEIGNGTNI